MPLLLEKNIWKKTKNRIVIFLSSFLFLFILSPIAVHAANLSLSPASGSFDSGSRIGVRVLVASNTAPYNAVSGTVYFPTSIFSIESVSKAGSVLDFWVTEPTVSVSAGTVKFEGIALGGTGGKNGTVIIVYIRANKIGSGMAEFKSGQILANDGQGTDITENLTGASYSVKEAQSVTPTPVPTPTSPGPVPPPAPAPVEESVEEEPQPPPTLEAPEIELGSKYGVPAIIGSSRYPKAQALITFTAADGVKVFILGVSDAEGGFVTVVPTSLKHGTYTVSAVMIKEDKTNSQTSNTITVNVGNILSELGWEVRIFIGLLILAVIYLAFRVYFHFGGKSDRSGERRKLKKIEELLYKVSERKTMEGMKKGLDSVEKAIDGEIENI